MDSEHVDVLIVGAGISGIGAAFHLQERCPGKSYAILEARADLGGTWDLFRYPGIRSDSDMHTLGFRFRPWTGAKAIADGPSILDYIRTTAQEEGIESRIRFNRRVVSAAWSSEDALWRVEAERTDSGETVSLTCGFLCDVQRLLPLRRGLHAGVRRGSTDSAASVIHPQHWPEDLDYEGKRVVVIGSGATAVTLVPAMAEKAAHVTMLQRSPTYVISLPGEDAIANFLRRVLPAKAAYAIVRWKNVLAADGQSTGSAAAARTSCERCSAKGSIKALPPGYDVDKHFNPTLQPLGPAPLPGPRRRPLRGDLRRPRRDRHRPDRDLHRDGASKLESGAELEADVIVTATGLNLLFLGGIELTVDGEEPTSPGR